MAFKQVQTIRDNVSPHWVGDGFPVRTMFSYNEPGVDPFLLLDYAEPYKFAPSRGRPGVGEHPHKGFETVTIVFQGELEHRDSSGSHGKIGPGDVQWMTAASGVVHEEFHSERFAREGGMFEVAQLWVNLPAAAKKERPRYQELLAKNIPTVNMDGAAIRVIAGELAGTKGPARTVTPIQLLDIQLEANANIELPIPAGYTAMLLVRNGNVKVNSEKQADGVSLLIFDRAGDEISLVTSAPAAAVLLAGQPIGEPVVGQGPFVMNTREEIRQAYSEYQSGAMGRLS
ncbi:MAG: pirin family protein [Pirellulales bacterium]